MSTKFLISLCILGAVVIPLGFGLFLILKNEIENAARVTGGTGIPVIISAILIFIILPVLMFIATFAQ